MDTISQPSFLFSYNGALITRRFVVFRKLCAYFADEITIGRDPAAKILTKILQFPPLRDVPLLNGVFDVLKESAFEYHMSRDRGITENLPGDLKQNDQGDTQTMNPSSYDLQHSRPKHDTFLPKEEMAACRNLTLKLSKAIYKHQQALESLQDEIKEYKNLDRKCLDAYRQMNNAAVNFNEYANDDGDNKEEFKEASMAAHKVYIQRTKEYVMYKEKSKMAFDKLYSQYKTEKYIKEERINRLDKDLRNIIVTEMRHTLTDGMKILMKIATSARFSNDLIDAIGNFDCATTAEKLYKDICLKYYHPIINQNHLDKVLGNTFYTVPHFDIMDKDERRFREHESYISLLDGEPKQFGQEELYVWANSTTEVKAKDDKLKLKRDMKIKQKFCSADGSLAFGWIRKFGCGQKHYGFYATNETRLVR